MCSPAQRGSEPLALCSPTADPATAFTHGAPRGLTPIQGFTPTGHGQEGGYKAGFRHLPGHTRMNTGAHGLQCGLEQDRAPQDCMLGSHETTSHS